MSSIWIGERYHRVRECAIKILAEYYTLVVPPSFVQLAKILLVKFLVILLASIRLKKEVLSYLMPHNLILQSNLDYEWMIRGS